MKHTQNIPPVPQRSSTISPMPTITSGTALTPLVYDLGGRTYAAGLTLSSLSYVTIKNGYFITLGHSIPTATSLIYQNCVFDIAAAQLLIGGGDRVSLTSSGNILRGCYFKNCTNIFTVALEGVGWLVDNCHFSNCGGRALQFGAFGAPPQGGNDGICQNSTFDSCSYQTVDDGCLYFNAKDCSQVGFQIINCQFTNITGPATDTATWAIYLDDHQSLVNITGCLFQNCAAAIIVNGGRDNFIGSNTFSTIKYNGIFLSQRSNDAWPVVSQTLEDITSAPYAKYPHLSALAASTGVISGLTCYTGDNAQYPIGNLIQNNTFKANGTAIKVTGSMVLVNSTVRSQFNVGDINNLIQ